MRVSDALSQLAYLLELVLAYLVLHVHPPIWIFLLGKNLLDSFLEGTAVKLGHVYLLRVEAYDLMVLGALLEDHAFTISSEFLRGDEERLNVRVWDFCLKLVILVDNLFYLRSGLRKILDIKGLLLLFPSRRKSFLIIILVYSCLGWWSNCI